MSRCVVVGGAKINNYEFAKNHIIDGDFVIYCDGGLYHMEKLEAHPDLIVGDFDSHVNPNLNVETIVLPTVKDDTDTVYAVKEAAKRGFSDFILLGALGGRFDHTLGNLAMLLYLEEQGLRGMLVDDFSEITLLSAEGSMGGTYRVSDDCKYFSVLSAMPKACGITIKNAKYEVEDAEITSSFPIGVSNEVIKGKEAEISVKSGKVFIIKVTGE